jgi:hypothetical protein
MRRDLISSRRERHASIKTALLLSNKSTSDRNITAAWSLDAAHHFPLQHTDGMRAGQDSNISAGSVLAAESVDGHLPALDLHLAVAGQLGCFGV